MSARGSLALSVYLLSWSEKHPQGTATCFRSLRAALEVSDCSALRGFLLGFQVVAPTACSSLTALCPQPPGSVRRTSSPARMATASGACGTVMVTMTAATIAMSSVVSAAPGRWAGWLAVGRECSDGSRTAQTSNLPGCLCVRSSWRKAGETQLSRAPSNHGAGA